MEGDRATPGCCTRHRLGSSHRQARGSPSTAYAATAAGPHVPPFRGVHDLINQPDVLSAAVLRTGRAADGRLLRLQLIPCDVDPDEVRVDLSELVELACQDVRPHAEAIVVVVYDSVTAPREVGVAPAVLTSDRMLSATRTATTSEPRAGPHPNIIARSRVMRPGANPPDQPAARSSAQLSASAPAAAPARRQAHRPPHAR